MSAGRWDRPLPERIEELRAVLGRLETDPVCLERTRAAVEEELRLVQEDLDQVERDRDRARQLNLF